jgi:quercetin dioxygenase-like cupin family protein
MNSKTKTLGVLASALILASITAAEVVRSAPPDGPHPSAGTAKNDKGPPTAEPGFFRKEFENPSVIVVRIHIPPHASIPAHDVTPRVVVWLTDAHLKMTFPDGTSQEQNFHAGQVAWVTPTRHAGENLSEQPIDFIAILPKGGTTGGTPAHAQGPHGAQVP